MQIREYQTWLEAYDTVRGWDKIAPAHTFLHLAEEMGEVAREVQYFEGYRDAQEAGDLRANLAEELADCATFVFKLAYQCGVDLENALRGNMVKAENRFSVEAGQAETERYLAHQAGMLANIQNKRQDDQENHD